MITAAEKLRDLNDKKGQVVQSAAEIYETFFTPALFRQWPPVVADLLNVVPQRSVLDVACGTGIFARHIAERFGNDSQVSGVDINAGMLAVAKQQAPGIQWHQAPAESLPFDDNSFDYVVCQFGLMFFQNREVAIQEMIRVLKPGGKIAFAVWDELDNSPGYKKVTELLKHLFGDRIANELKAPFVLGNQERLRQLMDCASIQKYEVRTVSGTAKFPSIEDWVFTDIKGWTLADLINDEQFEQLLKVAPVELQQFTNSSGEVRFAAPAHIVMAGKQ